MRLVRSQLSTTDAVAARGPVLIGAGLLVLLAAIMWPVLPGVTAMAVVALGATGVTVARYRGRPAEVPLLILHLAVYGGLYAVFVGAAIHAAAQRPQDGLGALLSACDVAVSLWPIGLACRLAGGVSRSGESAG